jgi:hypothetical protein
MMGQIFAHGYKTIGLVRSRWIPSGR